jgi:hypothetical protein
MAQLFHDRRQREARLRMTPEERKKTPPVDYIRPIIAVSLFNPLLHGFARKKDLTW